MVQTLLIFALGFLSAALIAVAAAPAIWSRATSLTRHRIESSIPITLNELQADKDQQRAEYALITRKLELAAKSTRDRLTAAQVEIARLETDLVSARDERDRLAASDSEKAKAIEGLDQVLSSGAQTIKNLEAERAELVALTQEAAADIEAKELQIGNLMIDADSHRIELANRLAEREQLNANLAEVKEARKSIEQNLRSTANELRAAQEMRRADKRHVIEAEKKLDRLTAQLTDREERLARRDAEVERLKDQFKTLSAKQNQLERQLAATERQRAHLETQNSSLSARLAKLSTIATNTAAERTIIALEKERDSLLATVERLTAAAGGSDRAKIRTVSEKRATNNELLRDKIHELTAKVVKMTADSEGANSPITAILDKADKVPLSSTNVQELPVSLASRIRSLEQAARRG